MTKLFTPIVVGKNTLPNRVFMAPLTRLRSIEPLRGKKSSQACIRKMATSRFSFGTRAEFLITAFSRITRRRLRLLL